MPAKLMLVSLLGLAAIHACASRLVGQSDSRKFEVGGQVTLLRLKEPIPRLRNPCFRGIPLEPGYSSNIYGFGGRASYKLNRLVAFDAEVNYFPEKTQEHFIQSDPRWQGLFGAQTGLRKKRVALFARTRLGFLRFNRLDRITDVDQVFQAPFGCVFELVVSIDEPKTVPNFDLGGTVEVYLPKRSFIRADAGDTIIHYPTRTEFDRGFTTHNFQVSAGLGVRF